MSRKINVGIVGVGNNASALIQGFVYYKNNTNHNFPGVRAKILGGYSISDFRFVCAFDVSRAKVGKDLSIAIFASPNNFPRVCNVPLLRVSVMPGNPLDSVASSLKSSIAIDNIPQSNRRVENVATILKTAKTDVLINFLPTGSPKAAKFYAKAAASAGCAFINATPDPIVHDKKIVELFNRKKLPLLGDDLESQMGATVIHRHILEILMTKGIDVTESYQINIGGNMDFRNLLLRGEAKAKSKRQGLLIPSDLDNISVVPAAAYFPFLGDRKVAYISVKGQGWLGCANTIEIKLDVQDSCSAASVAADLIRIAKSELELGTAGVVQEAGFYFKNPILKRRTHEAERMLQKYES